MLLEADRLTVDVPPSARLAPEDERWKLGCAGRCMLWFIDVDRTCEAVYGAVRSSWLDDTRLTAEAGCGIPEKFWMLPNVSRGRRTLNKPAGCDMLSAERLVELAPRAMSTNACCLEYVWKSSMFKGALRSRATLMQHRR